MASTPVFPNLVKILEEEIGYKKPITEGLLRKFASAINAICEEQEPECIFNDTPGSHTFVAPTNPTFCMVVGVGGGGGGGSGAARLGAEHWTDSFTPDPDDGIPGDHTTFGGSIISAGGDSGKAPVARSPTTGGAVWSTGYGYGASPMAGLGIFITPVSGLLTQGGPHEDFVVPFGDDPRFDVKPFWERVAQVTQVPLPQSTRLNATNIDYGRGGFGGIFGGPLINTVAGGAGQNADVGYHFFKPVPGGSYNYTVGAGGLGGQFDTATYNPATFPHIENGTDGVGGAIYIISWGF